ncbi:NDP-sugar epimerase, includes UDP-GlcNAc-inverting 4,6-dehydratase FlaA1 and capsular polysaccharide biosynthesis protein EpsC [Clostridium cavendishii DSM 21758]|uniref:NDP-sugar epimerase, includes UDP-GlcNAc-inverting 4,6-dehydratase FlaA1 and capsular polysaccharide biosynthesis protein EpsC n=1 Tax=Clostridium cavendishii DSM 21758 TaxID=1121302 RepID=A0A1M6Q5X9_9CLOT|nr:nucleoside-diphosphate sugar epimerase/dehydratase [Clostridium cavendishii]SHK15547.1 NDP-sugar epimerase, includes UDP-GlcNAc-inverting 4,6-dehydratase FlaA1 and capsular polysaccharide biosynthesis protein EpsC [Clostridium cavendishii DSM 21758]
MLNEKKLVVLDIISIVISIFLAFLLRFNFNIIASDMEFIKMSLIPVILITIATNYFFNLYKKMWEYASINELLSIIYSTAISNIIFFLYSYFINYKLLKYEVYRFPFTVYPIYALILVLMFGGIRFRLRIIGEKKNTSNSAISKNTLIIGAGDATAMLLKEIKKCDTYNVVGIIDDNKKKKGKFIYGYEVIGNRDIIVKACNKYQVDEIIFAMPSVKEEEKQKILEICKKTKCKLKTIPSLNEMIDGEYQINNFREIKIEDLLGRKEVELDIHNIEKLVKNKVILVTGGGGSIGSELCRQLIKFEPSNLVILDIYENNAYDLQMELNHNYPNMTKTVVISSIREYEKMDDIFNRFRPEIVFHAAAHKHVPLMEANPEEAIKNNILGTYNILKCSDKYNVKRFIQISTDKAVNPTNIMGATKRFCEIMVQAFNTVSKTEYVAVRFGNVLGSNGSVIPLFKKQISEGGPVTVTHPEINRFFMTIPEAAQLVIQAGTMAKGGEIFVLDMGKPVKIIDLAKDMIRLSGYEPGVDIAIEYTGLRPGEKLYEELLIDEIALTSTAFEKIYVEKPMNFEMQFVEDSIKEFKNVIATKDREAIFKIMEQKVLTYKRKIN